MKQYNIVVLRGDGIGPEIVAEAVKVLDAAGEKFGFRFAYDEQLMGGWPRRWQEQAPIWTYINKKYYY